VASVFLAPQTVTIKPFDANCYDLRDSEGLEQTLYNHFDLEMNLLFKFLSYTPVVIWIASSCSNSNLWCAHTDTYTDSLIRIYICGFYDFTESYNQCHILTVYDLDLDTP